MVLIPVQMHESKDELIKRYWHHKNVYDGLNQCGNQEQLKKGGSSNIYLDNIFSSAG